MAFRLFKVNGFRSMLWGFLMLLPLLSCGRFSDVKKSTAEAWATEPDTITLPSEIQKELVLGANRTEEYLPFLEGKTIGVVCNPSSLILKKTLPSGEREYIHLVDSLLSLDQQIARVFSPEHGFRGSADAGEKVADGKDPSTGLEIVSLYGSNKKPSAEQLEGLDVLIFDIQDVGVRFYTYIATMHHVMEAAAENDIPILIFDRPNPNGHYVDGPVMKKEHTSFLGMHAGVPLVHGMTIGEYAKMINEEGWLNDGIQADLTVIPMKNYIHDMEYSLPVRPSPNLPNDQSINLYPSLGLLEGTNLNAGRGTEMQFQVLGSPFLPKDKYTFCYTPAPNFGSKSPKHNGEECCGFDLRNVPRLSKVDLSWIIQAYGDHSQKEKFFNTKNFTAHAGTEKLQQQIEAGMTTEEIRESWIVDLEKFKKVRSKYLIYN